MARNKEFDYDEKLTVVRDLFWKKGYHATSLSDLENVTKVNRSSLYQTYGNKHDLFIKSLIHYMEKREKQYTNASISKEDPLESISAIVYSVLEAALKEDNCLFTNSIFELALADKEVSNLLQKQVLKAVDNFQVLLKKAQQNGQLDAEKDIKAVAHFLVSGLGSLYYNQILFQDIKLTKQTADLLIQSIR